MLSKKGIFFKFARRESFSRFPERNLIHVCKKRSFFMFAKVKLFQVCKKGRVFKFYRNGTFSSLPKWNLCQNGSFFEFDRMETFSSLQEMKLIIFSHNGRGCLLKKKLYMKMSSIAGQFFYFS